MSYTYLIGSLLLLCVWLAFFLRKDLRTEMWRMSVLVMILGVIMELFVWTKDWWRPTTITGTLIGVEDFILGFSMGGILAVCYEAIFRKRLALRKGESPHTQEVVLLLSLSTAIGVISWSLLNITSAISWLLATIIPTLILYILRSDLILPSLGTAALMLLITIPVYWIAYFIEPTLFAEWWLNHHLTGARILLIPIEDILWLFTLGMFIGPLYEFWQGSRLKSLR